MRSLQLLLAALLATAAYGFFLPSMPTATRRTAGSAALAQVSWLGVMRARVALGGRLAGYPNPIMGIVSWAAYSDHEGRGPCDDNNADARRPSTTESKSIRRLNPY